MTSLVLWMMIVSQAWPVNGACTFSPDKSLITCISSGSSEFIIPEPRSTKRGDWGNGGGIDVGSRDTLRPRISTRGDVDSDGGGFSRVEMSGDFGTASDGGGVGSPNDDIEVNIICLIGGNCGEALAAPYLRWPSEPIDVPAITESHEEEYGTTDWCNDCDGFYCTSMACDPHAKHTVQTVTCKDKSRILLTAEDGTKHCISFKGR